MQAMIKLNYKTNSDDNYSRALPLDIGQIYFVGIGGIGMSGIAELLHNLGYEVAGSDVAEGPNVTRLRGLGIHVDIGHDGANVANAAVVVKSTAVPLTNPEIMAARERYVPVVRRSEMLAELTRLKTTIAVAGAHGKTTTTSMMAALLDAAQLDPTVINGGIINAYGTNVHLGQSDWLVAEADESDGTFLQIPSAIGIITNIDPEHMDYWKSYDALKDAFKQFVHHLPFYGFAVLCFDDEDVRALAEGVSDRRIVTYAIDKEGVDVRAVNITHDAQGSQFDVELSDRVKGDTLQGVRLAIPGRHNISNALATIAVALELGIAPDVIIKGLENFRGVKRRFTRVGEARGITIIDDYAHHPVEIAATLKAAREQQDDVGKGGRVIAVVQPHRYSRLENLFKEFTECFADADRVIVTDIYAASEKPIPGVDAEALVSGIGEHAVHCATDEGEPVGLLAEAIGQHASEHDMVICMGAGSITSWAQALPKALA